VTSAERDALRAAMRLSYPSFPCLADKRPACPNGFKDAAPPTHGLATLWLRHPGELVGVPCGPASGLAVLDVDRGKGGGEWWTANKGRLPATRLHRTRSGGIHALFKHRAGLRNSASRIASGIDVRADGGYIIWWPAHGLPVDDRPLADWQDWLKPAEPKPAPKTKRWEPGDEKGLDEAQRENLRALRGAAQCVERGGEGCRNNVLYWAGRRFAEALHDGRPLPSFVTESWAADTLALAAARAGLMEREIAATIKSAGLGRA
jgi:Bifunctional DNA primase/polymerase, N-terminal